jgi:hypothetical protein
MRSVPTGYLEAKEDRIRRRGWSSYGRSDGATTGRREMKCEYKKRSKVVGERQGRGQGRGGYGVRRSTVGFGYSVQRWQQLAAPTRECRG